MARASVMVAIAVALAVPSAFPGARGDEIGSPKLRVDWAEFKKLYEARQVEVIDVRSEQAFEAGHIPAARSVPLADIGKQTAALRKLGKPLILYCA